MNDVYRILEFIERSLGILEAKLLIYESFSHLLSFRG